MSRRLVPDSAQPCIWMSAGLLTYKLCDRGFQCDRCPLDAGLRGRSRQNLCCHSLQTPDCGAAEFPTDRQYTRGHAWIMPLRTSRPRRVRFGLDAFAATILGHCQQITWHNSKAPFSLGDPVCDIDFGLGVISVGVPLACRDVEINPALQADPDRLLAEPYDRGWISEFTVSGDIETDRFLEADAAREKARLDLQWFRRQVALRLLAESGNNGSTTSNDVRPSADLREMLAGPTYLKLLPELVH